MPSLRVLHLTPYFEPAFRYGGPVRSVGTLCKALVRAGVEVTVFTTNADGDKSLSVPLGRPVYIDGVEVCYFGREFGPRRYYRCPTLLEAARKRIGEFDLVHSVSLWSYLMYVGQSVCASAGIPRIDSPRGGLMEWDLGHRYWKKWIYLRLFGVRQLNSAAAIHCTDEVEADAIRKLGLKPPVFVVPNAVDSAGFTRTSDRVSLRSRLGLPADSLVTLFMGRLSAKKGLDLALNSFQGVARERPEALFLIAGGDDDGTGRNARQLAHKLGLDDHVRFLGEISGEVRRDALTASDLFILTSHSENFGMAAAEAMAAGLPVLLSDKVGICPAAVRAGAGAITSLVVPEISRTWLRMLENPENLAPMGERGRAFVRNEFDPNHVAHGMVRSYEQVLAARV